MTAKEDRTTRASDRKPCDRCGITVRRTSRNYYRPILLCPDCKLVDPTWGTREKRMYA